jgi:DNA-binding transcriptional ArsR family regulator
MTDPDRSCRQGVDAVDKAALLADVSVYIRFHEALQTAWLERHPDKDAEPMDPAFAQEVHALLTNSPRLKAVVTEHLGYMWETILAPEWLRTVTMLEESVAAFEQLDISGLNVQEAIRLVAGREITVHWDLSQVEELTFVPTAHLGPYVRFFTHDNPKIAHIMFGARLPQGTRVQSPALSRSEMLVRLDALADDTRLQILRLLTIHEELCAQDIMIELQLSQSSASRHLRQLAATGYLTERRRDVAKCYSLNLDRVEDTLHALKRYLTTS